MSSTAAAPPRHASVNPAPSSTALSRPVRPTRPSRKPPRPRTLPPRPALERDRECLVTGVSAGLARHLGAPVWMVRALFIAITPLLGAGVLLYVWCWALMPWQPGEKVPSRRAPVAWTLVALSAVSAVASFYAWSDPYPRYEVELGAGYGYAFVAPIPLVLTVIPAVVLAVSAGLWAAFIDRRDPDRGARHAFAVRVVALAVLVVVLWVPLQRFAYDGVVTLLLAGAALTGLMLVLSSTLIERMRELSGERISRIRQEQRAEMAAHLHDSVLQTLALIQNRSGASSEVARLARAQERELRAWLYDGDAPADSDLPTDLRDYAGGLELDYPVRIDVVSAGVSTERASGDVAAAAREAMLNAARHAGGEISVYIEGTATSVDVFVRDRGPGFDLDAVPADRWGVRESIVGRMRRTGGVALIRPGAGGGTEVHLSLETAGARRA